MIVRKLLATTMAFVTLCDSILAVPFYNKDKKDFLESNIVDSSQLATAYFGNLGYVRGISDEGATADAYITAPEGSSRDCKLTGDAETMRLEQIIADVLCKKNVMVEEMEVNSFQANPTIHNQIVKLYSGYQEFFGVDVFNHKDVKKNTIFETLKAIGNKNFLIDAWDEKNLRIGEQILEAGMALDNSADIKYSNTWGGGNLKLTQNQIEYIQAEYKNHYASTNSVKEKKPANPVVNLFSQIRSVDGNNVARNNDRKACFHTALLVEAWKQKVTTTPRVIPTFYSIKNSIPNMLNAMPVQIKNRYNSDRRNGLDIKIDTFLEKKVFPLLSSNSHFAHYWKENLKKKPEETPIQELNRRFLDIQAQMNTTERTVWKQYSHHNTNKYQTTEYGDPVIRTQWNKLSTVEKLERLRTAENIMNNTTFSYTLYKKNELKFWLTALPIELSKQFDSSLKFLPTDKITTNNVKTLFDDYRGYLEKDTPSLNDITTLAEKLRVSIYYPRLNNTKNYSMDDIVVPTTEEDVKQSSYSNVVTQKGMKTYREKFAAEIRRFMKHFDFTDPNKSNYIDPVLLALNEDSSYANMSKMEKRVIERSDQILNFHPSNSVYSDYDVTNDSDELRYIRRVLIKLLPLLEDFNDNFTTTQAGDNFIMAIKPLFSTFGNCPGGQRGAAKLIADKLFYDKEVSTSDEGKQKDIIETSLNDLIHKSFNNVLNEPEIKNQGQAIHYAGSAHTQFRNRGIYNSSALKDTWTSFDNNIGKFTHVFVSNLWGTKVPEHVLSLLETKEDALFGSYIKELESIYNESLRLKSRIQERKDAPQKIIALNKAKAQFDRNFAIENALEKIKDIVEEDDDDSDSSEDPYFPKTKKEPVSNTVLLQKISTEINKIKDKLNTSVISLPAVDDKGDWSVVQYNNKMQAVKPLFEKQLSFEKAAQEIIGIMNSKKSEGIKINEITQKLSNLKVNTNGITYPRLDKKQWSSPQPRPKLAIDQQFKSLITTQEKIISENKGKNLPTNSENALKQKIDQLTLRAKANKENRPLTVTGIIKLMTEMNIDVKSKDHVNYDNNKNPVGITHLGITLILEKMGWMYRHDSKTFKKPNLGYSGVWTTRY